MKVVGGPRRISKSKPLLYLYRVGSFYLSCEEFERADHFRHNGRAKYFRIGQKRMYRTLPWFRSEADAREAAEIMGFRVKSKVPVAGAYAARI